MEFALKYKVKKKEEKNGKFPSHYKLAQSILNKPRGLFSKFYGNWFTEQYFPVVLFIMLYKVVLTFESVDKILKCDHSNESY